MSSPAVELQEPQLLCSAIGCDHVPFMGPDRWDQLAAHEAEDHAEEVDLTPGPEFPCDQCAPRKGRSVSFALEAALDYHRALIHGPLVCLATGCSWRFIDVMGRRVHASTKHRGGVFECCGEPFTGYSAFGRHQSRKHLLKRRRRPPVAPVKRLPQPRPERATRKEPSMAKQSPPYPCRYPECGQGGDSPQQRGAHERHVHGGAWTARAPEPPPLVKAPDPEPAAPGLVIPAGLVVEEIAEASTPTVAERLGVEITGSTFVTNDEAGRASIGLAGTGVTVWFDAGEVETLEAAAFLADVEDPDHLLNTWATAYLAKLGADEDVQAVVSARRAYRERAAS